MARSLVEVEVMDGGWWIVERWRGGEVERWREMGREMGRQEMMRIEDERTEAL